MALGLTTTSGYLGERFDTMTRTLGSLLFLLFYVPLGPRAGNRFQRSLYSEAWEFLAVAHTILSASCRILQFVRRKQATFSSQVLHIELLSTAPQGRAFSCFKAKKVRGQCSGEQPATVMLRSFIALLQSCSANLTVRAMQRAPRFVVCPFALYTGALAIRCFA